MFTHEGPSEQQLAETTFAFTNIGRGYSQGAWRSRGGPARALCLPYSQGRGSATPCRGWDAQQGGAQSTAWSTALPPALAEGMLGSGLQALQAW